MRSLAVPNLHHFGSNQPVLASVFVIAIQAAMPGTCEVPDLRLDSMLGLCLHIAVTTLSLGLYPTAQQAHLGLCSPSVFLILQANDRHLEMAGQSELFRKYPRKASILNMPLVTTLFYSCFYHYTEAEVRLMWQKIRFHLILVALKMWGGQPVAC